MSAPFFWAFLVGLTVLAVFIGGGFSERSLRRDMTRTYIAAGLILGAVGGGCVYVVLWGLQTAVFA